MLDLLRNRRSARKYTDQKIEPEKIELLKEALLRSPSGRDIHPWFFAFVENKDMLEKLSHAKARGGTFLSGAALGIVICANEELSNVWIEDSCIASITVQYAATSLGLGSCWIQLRNRKYNESISSEKYIAELLDLPEKTRVLSIISIGYSNEEKKLTSKDDLTFDRIIEKK
jgi:nitroreductase